MNDSSEGHMRGGEWGPRRVGGEQRERGRLVAAVVVESVVRSEEVSSDSVGVFAYFCIPSGGIVWPQQRQGGGGGVGGQALENETEGVEGSLPKGLGLVAAHSM
jgi:hypothetical protein